MLFFVLGCGSIGARHIRNLKSLGYDDIVAFDLNQELLKEVARTHGILPVDSIEEGISKGPAVALICLPHNLHIECAIPLAAAGIHLFIEKPLDLSLERLPELRELIERYALITMVGCNFRFDRGLIHLQEMLASGSIGRALSMRATFGYYLPDWRPTTHYRENYAVRRKTGGGVLLDRIHEFDYVTWLMGPVTNSTGIVSRIGDLEIETEDTADIVFSHKSGAISNIHVDYLRREYLCQCEVLGTEGVLSWDFSRRTAGRFLASNKKWEDFSADIPADINDMYVEQLKYFMDCVRLKRQSFNTVADGATLLSLVLGLREELIGI